MALPTDYCHGHGIVSLVFSCVHIHHVIRAFKSLLEHFGSFIPAWQVMHGMHIPGQRGCVCTWSLLGKDIHIFSLLGLKGDVKLL